MNKQQLERLDETARAVRGDAGERGLRGAGGTGAGDLPHRLRTRSQASRTRAQAKRADVRVRAGPSRPAKAVAPSRTQRDRVAPAPLHEPRRAGSATPPRDRRSLASEAARYRAHFEDAPDAYLVTDADGVIREANRAAARMLDAPVALLVGKPLVRFVARGDRGVFRGALRAVGDARGPAPIDGLEVRLRPRAPSAVAVVELVARAARRPSGAVEAVRWTARAVRPRITSDARGPMPDVAAHEAELRHVLELEETMRRQSRVIEELVGLGWPSTDASGAATSPAIFDLAALMERAVASLRGRALAVDDLILEALPSDPRAGAGAVHARTRGPAAGETPDPLRATADATVLVGAADLRGLRVLLVEGDEESGEHLLDVLRARGADAIAVTSAEQAVAALRARPPDVLVSAIRLPDHDGYALIREVRALGRDHGGAVPAVALTGYASIEEARDALAAGFQLHVAKPVDEILFTHAVANVAGAPITELVV